MECDMRTGRKIIIIVIGSIIAAYGITLAMYAGFGGATLAVFYDRSQIQIGTILYQVIYSFCVDLFANTHVYSIHVWVNALIMLLGVLLFANGAFGQPMLWDDASSETIVFELTNKEALKLLKGKLRQKQWKKIQQTPFARFTETWNNPPVKGHFLLADVERNEVHYVMLR